MTIVASATEHTAAQNGVLTGVVDQLEDGIDRPERVTVGDLVSALNDRGFGALAALIGGLAAMPVVGAIPGVSVGCAVMVLIVAGQYIAGRRTPWIPAALRQRSLSRETFDTALEKVRPYARWTDRLIRPRLAWLVGGRTERRIIAIAMFLLGLAMLPLAIIPWGVFLPALAITAFGIAITGRDGLFAVIGYALFAATAYTLYAAWGAIASLL